ncbi:MAG: DEAD/DEAH box helicase [Dehalococcoidia bacterium]
MPDETAINPNDKVFIYDRRDWGVGEVLRVRESGGIYQAEVAFEGPDGRRLETVPVERLRPAPELWERLAAGDVDHPLDFLLKQLAYQLPLHNSGGELSASRTQLLPHQILLTHDLVGAGRRRFLIADEVGLGKTIEAGMIIRELIARGEADRVLVICPAGLIRNWRQELRDAFRLHFEVLGEDFADRTPEVWQFHHRVIASIDTVKKPKRIEALKLAPRWDLIVIDEAHHLTRRQYGKKIEATQNYRLAEALRGYTRDLLFLTATPHQGDPFQFWSIVQLLDDQLFESPDAMTDHHGLLNRVMVRRTKREVTDAEGRPIFMRRQVHTQRFPMAARERQFYDLLTEYLREGYDVAGLGQARTTSQQRAVGFVMATFQKIMSSSPRAIKQALRRRLLALLARQQMNLESQPTSRRTPEAASRIVSLQEEMRQLAIAINGIPASSSQMAEADGYIAQVKQKVARRGVPSEEVTQWALDGDEEGEEGIYAEAAIPNEVDKVRELLSRVPEGRDRKFDTLVRAIEQIRRGASHEKFVIFTQYRDTMDFLREELSKLYAADKVATLKGGPLDEKIAAVEALWDPEGAQFLVSTSAGGEGINLQVAHILFNYDLPWNPMAVEQRIGRIHRYGQVDTAQVYNLVAEDTVEEKIYALLEQKLLEIARTIGKVDHVTGEVLEDFRSEILGFLGSSPNYQELYKRALVDRDYRRTETEIAEAIERARRASEALRNLVQDLETFNLDNYRALQGHFSMDDLRLYVEKAILRLGGAFLPDGELYRIETPQTLLRFPHVAPRYQQVTFDRNVAMRRRGTELLGLGHPLVDALIVYLQGPSFPGEVAVLGAEGGDRESICSARLLITAELEANLRRKSYRNVLIEPGGSCTEADGRSDIDRLAEEAYEGSCGDTTGIARQLAAQIQTALNHAETEERSSVEAVRSVYGRLVGLCIY